MIWILLAQAGAVEPDLSGLHVALGGGLTTSLGPFSDAAQVAEPSFRLHLGPRFIAELSASGGRFTESDLRWEGQPADEGGYALIALDEVALKGWRASAGARLLGRVAHRDGLDAYLGFSGSYAASDASGQLLQDVLDDTTSLRVATEVGTQRETRGVLSAGVAFSAVHWVTERVAVSGLLDVRVYGVDQTTRTRTWELPFDAEDLLARREQDIGGAPVVGLAAHLRL